MEIQNNKNLGGRPLKAIKYQKEKNDILIILNNILGITETNNIFYLYDIDNDENKKNQIMDLLDDCKKYFNTSEWTVVARNVTARRYLSLTRSIYKAMNYKLTSMVKTDKQDNKFIKRTGYIVTKPNNQ